MDSRRITWTKKLLNTFSIFIYKQTMLVLWHAFGAVLWTHVGYHVILHLSLIKKSTNTCDRRYCYIQWGAVISFVVSKSHFYSLSVTSFVCAMSCYIRPRYNDARLYRFRLNLGEFAQVPKPYDMCRSCKIALAFHRLLSSTTSKCDCWVSRRPCLLVQHPSIKV